MKKRFFFILCFFILLKLSVAAAMSMIGSAIPYDQRIVVFKPGEKVDFSFTVGDGGGIEAYIRTDSELEPYVTLIDADPRGGTRPVTVRIKFGDSLSPGEHRITIGAREGGGGVGVAAVTGVETAIRVISLSSEKAIQGYISVEDVNEGDNASLNVHIKSWSYQDIQSVYAELRVLDTENNEVWHFRTNELPLKSGQEAGLSGIMETKDVKPGWYNAFANIFFDGSNTTVGDDFRIGALKVDIGHYTQELKADSLNKFEMDIQSNWNAPLTEVYGEVDWNGKKEKTPNIDLPRFGGGTLTTYLDSNGVKIGEYPITMRVFYNKEKTERVGTVRVVREQGTIEKPTEVKGEFSYYVYAVLLILIVLNLLLIIAWRRKKSAKENTQQIK